jgi:hypothetical protein
LPCEVRLGSATNLLHEVVVFDAAHGVLERGRERHGSRDDATKPALRRAIHLDLTYAEA